MSGQRGFHRSANWPVEFTQRVHFSSGIVLDEILRKSLRFEDLTLIQCRSTSFHDFLFEWNGYLFREKFSVCVVLSIQKYIKELVITREIERKEKLNI